MNPSANDLNILRSYNFLESDNWEDSKFNRKNNDLLLGVKNSALITIDPKLVTFGNLFLRIFNLGKLAHTSIKIGGICKHLEKYNWKSLENDDKAQVNIQKIAAKCFNIKFLMENSNLTHTIHGRFLLTESTSARDLQRQMPSWMKPIRIDDNGVETPILPTEKINSKSSVDSICIGMLNPMNGHYSVSHKDSPHNVSLDFARSRDIYM